MRRRISSESLRHTGVAVATATATAAAQQQHQQALLDHKRAALEVILSEIPNTCTFAQLGSIIGYSHEWVRGKLVEHPEKLYKIGRRWQVPRGTAVELVRATFV